MPAGAKNDSKGEIAPLPFEARAILEKIEPVASWLFRVGMTVCLFAFAYTLFGLLSSGALTAQSSGTAGGDQATQQAAFQQLGTLSNNVRLASQILCWALIGVSLSLVVLAFDVSTIGVATVIIGSLLRFGAPIVFVKMFGQNVVTGNVAKVLVTSPALLIVVIIGLVKCVMDFGIWLVGLPDRIQSRADVGVAKPAEAKQRAIAAHANMLSPCWQLPFCREVVRKQCPAFLAKKRCWKFGRGCYCDEEMISRIIRGESLEAIKAPTRMTRQGKPPCGRCHIYLEHQRHKFRWLSPLAIPGTIAAMFFGWPFYLMAFGLLWKGIQPLFAAMSFDPKALASKAFDNNTPGAYDYAKIDPKQVQALAQNGTAVIVGFLALIYISKFVEWSIYKMKW